MKTDTHSHGAFPAGLQAKEKKKPCTFNTQEEERKTVTGSLKVMVNRKHKQKEKTGNGNIIASSAHTLQILL